MLDTHALISISHWGLNDSSEVMMGAIPEVLYWRIAELVEKALLPIANSNSMQPMDHISTFALYITSPSAKNSGAK
jgi:hypothetical protein